MMHLHSEVIVNIVPDLLSALLNATAVLIAALVGLAGLWIVNSRERQQRTEESSHLGFEKLMAEMSVRAVELSDWLNSPIPTRRDAGETFEVRNFRDPQSTTFGPLDAKLQTAADIAVMSASPKDKKVAIAIADLLFHLKRALTTWQIRKLGEIVGDIRKWKSGDLSEAKFIAELNAMKVEIEAGEQYRAETGDRD